MGKEVFIAIETVLDREAGFPIPISRCIGVFGDKSEAKIRVNKMYEECRAASKQSLYDAQPLDDEDEAYVIPVDGDGLEYYWRIDSAECQSLL